ncbi:MAG: hypothetical protein JWM05_238 [Acidimicrobiales bacterium]|nr:hypothetical protein [Acidimicrobiales bacterium]
MPWSPLPDPNADGPAPRALPDVLDQVLAGLGAPAVDVLVRLHDRWDELVGAEVAEHARPVAIERGVLSVVVDNPAWAGHLRWATADVMRQLDRLLGPGEVTRIRVRVGGEK